MTSDNRWLLPDGIEELLPERAGVVETLRRRLLDTCDRWGYRYVIPPLVEFTDSLLVGLGADLSLLTCKFVDRLSGRTLGVRADITPQVARIDAHSLNEPGVTRLCYAGSTLHSTPQSVMSGRSPIQLGAELYGSAGIEADLEVIALMLTLLDASAIAGRHLPVTFDVGHVGVFEAVIADAGLAPEAVAAVFDALQRKSAPDLEGVLATLPAAVGTQLRALARLHGEASVLDRARTEFADSPAALAAVNTVATVVDVISRDFPEVAIYIDLAELRGFRYHTGLVFAGYLEGVGTAVAKGGRYDNVGGVFGRDRPATGFACDLKAMASALLESATGVGAIAAPALRDADLARRVSELRGAGEVVITAIDGAPDPRCDRQLVRSADGWILTVLEPSEGQ